MEKISTIVYGVVVLVVMVLVIVTTAIPIIENSQNVITTTNDNVNYRYLSTSSSDEELTFNILDSGTNHYIINGVEFVGANSRVAVAGDNIIVTMSNNNFILNHSQGKVSGVTSFTWNDGVISYTVSDTDYELEVGDIYYASTNGNMAVYYGNDSRVVNIDKNIDYLVVGFSSSDHIHQTLHIKNNQIVSNPMYYFGGADHTNTISVTSTEEIYYYAITQIEVTTSYSDSSEYVFQYGDGVTLTVFAPVEYTIVDDSSPLYSMLAIIPLLLMIVPVMFIVRMLGVGRD